jgi:hypothetical protein
MNVGTLVLAAVLMATPVGAQVPAPERRGGEAVQHGAQPNPAEVRPGNRDGDAPSAAVGDLVAKPGRRLFGLPITTVLVIAGVLLGLVAVAGVAIPAANWRRRARGGGTYGGSERLSRR